MQILEEQNIIIYNTQKVNISKHGEHRGLRLANIYKLYRKPTIQVLAHMQVWEAQNVNIYSTTHRKKNIYNTKPGAVIQGSAYK